MRKIKGDDPTPRQFVESLLPKHYTVKETISGHTSEVTKSLTHSPCEGEGIKYRCMSEIKQLTLDCASWRSGENSNYKTGKGKVALLNKEGYMCCLGQWSKQLGKSDDELLGLGEPQEIKNHLDFFTEVDIEADWEYGEIESPLLEITKSDRSFVAEAMRINDDEGMHPTEKILKLKELLANEGVELIVINEKLLDNIPF